MHWSQLQQQRRQHATNNCNTNGTTKRKQQFARHPASTHTTMQLKLFCTTQGTRHLPLKPSKQTLRAENISTTVQNNHMSV